MGARWQKLQTISKSQGFLKRAAKVLLPAAAAAGRGLAAAAAAVVLVLEAVEAVLRQRKAG